MYFFKFILFSVLLTACTSQMCKYLGDRYPKGHVIEHYEEHCARLICNEKTVEFILQRKPKCNCNLNLETKSETLRSELDIMPDGNVTINNLGNFSINDLTWNITLRGIKKCVVNNREYADGEVVFELEENCLILKCHIWRNRAASLKPSRIEGCTECSELQEFDCKMDIDKCWTYRGRFGQKRWGNIYPACNGIGQSPINLNAYNLSTPIEIDYTKINDTGYLKNPACLRLSNYDQSITSLKVVNNGRFIEIKLEFDRMRPSIINSYLSTYEYIFSHIEVRVEEHSYIGEKIPFCNENATRAVGFEMHLMHYKKIYGSYLSALDQLDDRSALVDLSVFISFEKIDKFNNFCNESSLINVKAKKKLFKLMDKLVDSLKKVKKPEQEIYVNAGQFKLSDIFKNNEQECLGNYVSYFGSLPYPPCHENFLNIFYRNIQNSYRSEEFINKFIGAVSKLKFIGDEDLFPFGNAYRELQADNSRAVSEIVLVEKTTSTSASTSAVGST